MRDLNFPAVTAHFAPATLAMFASSTQRVNPAFAHSAPGICQPLRGCVCERSRRKFSKLCNIFMAPFESMSIQETKRVVCVGVYRANRVGSLILTRKNCDSSNCFVAPVRGQDGQCCGNVISNAIHDEVAIIDVHLSMPTRLVRSLPPERSGRKLV
jgi:hypothetical protein